MKRCKLDQSIYRASLSPHQRVHRWRQATLMFSLGLILLCTSLAAHTENQPWIQKDWTQWSAADCDLVLNKSPWVKVNPSDSPRPYAKSADRWSDTQTIIRILSALPIQQALLRRMQLKKKYDEMNPGNRLKFDQKNARDFGAYDSAIVIEIVHTFSRPVPNEVPDQSLVGEFVSEQAALRRPDGTRVLPVRTTILERTVTINRCEYVFPREIDGRPLYTTNDSSLQLERGGTLTVDSRTRTVVQEAFRPSGQVFSFRIADLIYKSHLEY